MSEASKVFFHDLWVYNTTNFNQLKKADINCLTDAEHKAFSSAITRYFIFCERHPEIPESEKNALYYEVSLDLVARYFNEYPASEITGVSGLATFQSALNEAVVEHRLEGVTA